MATKVLSIEIGQGLTRVVEMDYKVKNPKVYNYFTFETPKDVIDDGMVKRSEAFTGLFKAECEKKGIKTTQVVFSVNSSRIARRDAKIPFVKEKQIQDLLDASATDYFPVDMSSYHLAYDIVEKIAKGDEKGYRLNLLAVPNELTASYFDFAQSLGCHLLAVDYVGNSVYQIVRGANANGVDVLLKVDEATTLITVLKDGKIDLQRSIAYGINEAVETVRANAAFGENLTYAQAVSVLCGKTCIRRFLNPEAGYQEKEDTDKNITEARVAVTESLRHLIGMIGRVLEYYVSHNQGVQIDDMTLIGLGADFSGLSKLLTNELNHKVKVLQDNQVDVVNKVEGETTLRISRYAACLGAAMGPMNLIPEQGKGGKAVKTRKAGDAVTSGLIVLAIGVLVAAVLCGISYGKQAKLNNEKAKVEAHIAQLEEAGVEAVYEEYVTVKQLAERMDAIYTSTLSRSEDLVEFIAELEQKMPASLLVINFTATSQNVNMSIEVDSKEAAAETLMQLRTFDSIEVVSSAGLTDNLDETDSIVAFTVECVYKPVVPEVETETEAE